MVCRFLSSANILHLIFTIFIGTSVAKELESNVVDNEYGGAQGNRETVNAVQNSQVANVVESIKSMSLNGNHFDPIALKFPDTPARNGEAAKKYVKDLLAPLKSGASEKDPNLEMTGQSCARGLGSLYIV